MSATGPIHIASTATAVPAHHASLDEYKRVFADAFARDARHRQALGSMLDAALIETRHSVLPPDQIGVRKPLGDAMTRYRQEAITLGKRVAAECLDRAGLRPGDIDFLVTVSCTGFMIPALDAHLVNELGFRSDVRRLPITELGCVGGAAALCRAHDLLLGRPDARALVIAVELPSLCFQPQDETPANLVSSAIFADGAAAVLMTGGQAAEPAAGAAVLATQSRLIPDTIGALGFDLRDDGFHVVLARDLPERLRAGLPEMVATLLEAAGVDRAALASFVLHPGGRKVLSAVEEALGLRREETEASWDVLRDFGNQSSASVLFVLDEHMRRRRPLAGSHGLLGAFGPGLGTELMVLRWN